MKDIIHHFSIGFGLCVSLIFIAQFAIAQSEVKDTVFVSDNETVHAHYLNGKAVGNWTIVSKNGSFETGRVELKQNVPKIHQTTNPWGYQVGKWNYYESDSSLAYISEYNYSKNNRIYELKAFGISQSKDTIFIRHFSEKQTLFGSKTLKYYEDGHLKEFHKANFWRRLQKSYHQDKSNSTTEYFYSLKFIKSPIKTRTKRYNLKRKNHFENKTYSKLKK